MAQAFNRVGANLISGLLDPVELQLLQSLLAQLAQLLHESDDPSPKDPLAELVGISDLVERPADPALLRLFPDAYRSDESAATDFRRYTEAGLRQKKTASVDTALSILRRSENKIELTNEEAQVLLAAINDTRLVLATRLGLVDEASLPKLLATESDKTGAAHLYEWLTWLQETLVIAVMQKN